MNFSAATIAERTPAGQRQSVESESKSYPPPLFFFFFFFSLVPPAPPTHQLKLISFLLDNVAHVYAHPQGVSGMIISDKDYPSRVAFSLLNKIMDEFLVKFPADVWRKQDTIEYPELAEYLRKYQDPQQADNIMKVQKELDETTAILVSKVR
jgi:synaptobrevin family protein YKT6